MSSSKLLSESLYKTYKAIPNTRYLDEKDLDIIYEMIKCCENKYNKSDFHLDEILLVYSEILKKNNINPDNDMIFYRTLVKMDQRCKSKNWNEKFEILKRHTISRLSFLSGDKPSVIQSPSVRSLKVSDLKSKPKSSRRISFSPDTHFTTSSRRSTSFSFNPDDNSNTFSKSYNYHLPDKSFNNSTFYDNNYSFSTPLRSQYDIQERFANNNNNNNSFLVCSSNNNNNNNSKLYLDPVIVPESESDNEMTYLQNQKCSIANNYYSGRLKQKYFYEWKNYLDNNITYPLNGSYIFILLKWIKTTLRLKPNINLPNQIYNELQSKNIPNSILNRISISSQRYEKVIQAITIMQKWQKLRIFHGWFNISNSVSGIRKKYITLKDRYNYKQMRKMFYSWNKLIKDKKHYSIIKAEKFYSLLLFRKWKNYHIKMKHFNDLIKQFQNNNKIYTYKIYYKYWRNAYISKLFYPQSIKKYSFNSWKNYIMLLKQFKMMREYYTKHLIKTILKEWKLVPEYYKRAERIIKKLNKKKLKKIFEIWKKYCLYHKKMKMVYETSECYYFHRLSCKLIRKWNKNSKLDKELREMKKKKREILCNLYYKKWNRSYKMKIGLIKLVKTMIKITLKNSLYKLKRITRIMKSMNNVMKVYDYENKKSVFYKWKLFADYKKNQNIKLMKYENKVKSGILCMYLEKWYNYKEKERKKLEMYSICDIFHNHYVMTKSIKHIHKITCMKKAIKKLKKVEKWRYMVFWKKYITFIKDRNERLKVVLRLTNKFNLYERFLKWKDYLNITKNHEEKLSELYLKKDLSIIRKIFVLWKDYYHKKKEKEMKYKKLDEYYKDNRIHYSIKKLMKYRKKSQENKQLNHEMDSYYLTKQTKKSLLKWKDYKNTKISMKSNYKKGAIFNMKKYVEFWHKYSRKNNNLYYSHITVQQKHMNKYIRKIFKYWRRYARKYKEYKLKNYNAKVYFYSNLAKKVFDDWRLINIYRKLEIKMLIMMFQKWKKYHIHFKKCKSRLDNCLFITKRIKEKEYFEKIKWYVKELKMNDDCNKYQLKRLMKYWKEYMRISSFEKKINQLLVRKYLLFWYKYRLYRENKSLINEKVRLYYEARCEIRFLNILYNKTQQTKSINHKIEEYEIWLENTQLLRGIKKFKEFREREMNIRNLTLIAMNHYLKYSMKKYLQFWSSNSKEQIIEKCNEAQLNEYISMFYIMKLKQKIFNLWNENAQILKSYKLSDEFHMFYQKKRGIIGLLKNKRKYERKYKKLLKRWLLETKKSISKVNSIYCHLLIKRWKKYVKYRNLMRIKILKMYRRMELIKYKNVILKWKNYIQYTYYRDEIYKRYCNFTEQQNYNLLYRIFQRWIVYHNIKYVERMNEEKADTIYNRKLERYYLRKWYYALTMHDSKQRYLIHLKYKCFLKWKQYRAQCQLYNIKFMLSIQHWKTNMKRKYFIVWKKYYEEKKEEDMKIAEFHNWKEENCLKSVLNNLKLNMMLQKEKKMKVESAKLFSNRLSLKHIFDKWKSFHNEIKEEKEEKKKEEDNKLRVILKEWKKISKYRKAYKLQMKDIETRFNKSNLQSLFIKWKNKVHKIKMNKNEVEKRIKEYENDIPLKRMMFNNWRKETKIEKFKANQAMKKCLSEWKSKFLKRKEHDREIYSQEGGSILYYFRKWFKYLKKRRNMNRLTSIANKHRNNKLKHLFLDNWRENMLNEKVEDYLEEKRDNILSKYFDMWNKMHRLRHKQYVFIQTLLHGPIAAAFYKLKDYNRHYKRLENAPKLNLFKVFNGWRKFAHKEHHERESKRIFINRMKYSKSLLPYWKYWKSLTQKLRNLEEFETKRKTKIKCELLKEWKKNADRQKEVKEILEKYESHKVEVIKNYHFKEWKDYVKSKKHYEKSSLSNTFNHWKNLIQKKKKIMNLLSKIQKVHVNQLTNAFQSWHETSIPYIKNCEVAENHFFDRSVRKYLLLWRDEVVNIKQYRYIKQISIMKMWRKFLKMQKKYKKEKLKGMNFYKYHTYTKFFTMWKKYRLHRIEHNYNIKQAIQFHKRQCLWWWRRYADLMEIERTIHDNHNVIIAQTHFDAWKSYFFYKLIVGNKYIKNWYFWTKKSKLLKEAEVRWLTLEKSIWFGQWRDSLLFSRNDVIASRFFLHKMMLKWKRHVQIYKGEKHYVKHLEGTIYPMLQRWLAMAKRNKKIKTIVLEYEDKNNQKKLKKVINQWMMYKNKSIITRDFNNTIRVWELKRGLRLMKEYLLFRRRTAKLAKKYYSTKLLKKIFYTWKDKFPSVYMISTPSPVKGRKQFSPSVPKLSTPTRLLRKKFSP